MTDSIKFGPEWLRNMSQGISKPQLAEHRYGREEMLALFDISSCNIPPESLKELSMVYNEKPQNPLSLQQMSEEETRLWNRGINSDTIIRASVRTTGSRGTTNIEVRGGSTSTRGRGGRGGYYYSTTRPGYEEGPEGGGSPMNRGPHRPFERLNSNERNMNRNGEYTNDWRGRDESNWWRKNRGGAHQGQSDESNGRWGRTRTDSYNNDRWPAGRPTSKYDEDEGWDRGESRWSNNATTHERRKLDWGETLPEWAVDNPGEKGGSFDSSGAFHDNHYEEEHHYNMGDELSREERREYEEDNDNGDTSVNNIESSNMSPVDDKQLNGREKEVVVSSSISTSPSHNEEVISSPERFKSMRQQHQHTINAQTTKEVFIQNEQVMASHPEPVRIQQVPDIPVIHSKSSPAIPHMADCQPNKIENIKNLREMPGIGNHIDNTNINPIHRSTSLNANAHHRIDTLDAEAESMVSRLTSDNFKIGPSSHSPLAPLTNNKWYYRDPQGEVQGPFLTTEMAEWYSLGYFHDNMLMVKRACDEHFYSLGDLVRLKGNVPFSDTPFSEHDVKISGRIGVQPPPTHNPFTMNDSLVLQQQQQQQQYQYRQLFLKQRELAIQSAVHQLSQSERWNTLSPMEQQQLIMHHIRNVEANTAIPPMFAPPIHPQPQPTPNIHPMNPPPNNNLMVMLSHMQQQQQQQHFNHQIDPKHIHSVPPSQPITQQLDPLHSLVQSMGGLKTSTPPPVNSSHHHQSSNIIRPNSAQPENNPISDLLRQLGAPQDKPLKVTETSVWGMDFTGPDSKPKMNGPIGISGWQTGPSIETSQQTPGVVWGSGEYTKIIGADHKAIEETIKEEARRSQEARKQEIKQNEQIKKREAEKSRLQKEFKKKQELEKAQLEDEKKKEETRRIKEHEKKLKEDAERKRIEKRKLEEEQTKKREHEKKIKEEKEKRLLEEKKKEEEKRLLEEEKKRKSDLKKKEEQKKKEELKKKDDLKRKEDSKKHDQKKKEDENKKKQDTSRSSSVPIVTEPQKKKKKEPQTVAHNGIENASAPWAAADQKKQVQVKSMAEIQAEEQKREQLMKQKERERTEREMSMVAIEQAKQEKARSAVKMQSWSTVITKNVPQSTPVANNSVWGSSNQTNTDKPLVQKSNKTPAVAVNNKSNVKNVAKTVNQTVQQTNAMKKVIESRGENNNCTDEFSQWCCKHLATLNKNTIDIPTFVTFLKDVESEYEVKDYIQSYLGDNKEVREFCKQFFDKRLKIQNKQRSSDFVEMKSKNKKRNKMVPLDNKVLGFNVVASERINVGELDLGE